MKIRNTGKSLCDTCEFDFPDCPEEHMLFGYGHNEDHVMECSTYIKKGGRMGITINDMEICKNCGVVVSTLFAKAGRCPVCRTKLPKNYPAPVPVPGPRMPEPEDDS